MSRKSYFEFLLTILIFCCFQGQAFAVNRHKIIVMEFKDPSQWQKTFSPGKIISSHLKKLLEKENRFHFLPKKDNGMSNPLIRDENHDEMKEMSPVADKMSKIVEDPTPWPVRLGKIPEKASLFEIRGQVVKFDADTKDNSMETLEQTKKQNAEDAELEVRLRIVQNKTGRVVDEQKFKAFSNSGKRPFSEKMDLDLSNWNHKTPSSMGLAMSFLAREMVSYVTDLISPNPLEGEIIALKNKDVLINIGKQNGVEVGDRFRVFSVGLGLNDPLTKNDLGDIYVKMGVIQVMESMQGFSRAITIAGKDFMPGNLVRSTEIFNQSGFQALNRNKTSRSQEPIPWWDFNGIKSVP